MLFQNRAKEIDKLLKTMFDVKLRKSWDVRLRDHYLIEQNPVTDTMLILEEESEKVVRGYPQREVIYKRLHWQDEGSYFVYQSSVPDAIHPDVDFAEDDAIRYDLIH